MYVCVCVCVWRSGLGAMASALHPTQHVIGSSLEIRLCHLFSKSLGIRPSENKQTNENLRVRLPISHLSQTLHNFYIYVRVCTWLCVTPSPHKPTNLQPK